MYQNSNALDYTYMNWQRFTGSQPTPKGAVIKINQKKNIILELQNELFAISSEIYAWISVWLGATINEHTTRSCHVQEIISKWPVCLTN